MVVVPQYPFGTGGTATHRIDEEAKQRRKIVTETVSSALGFGIGDLVFGI
jgi:hypothetical protein